MIDFPLIKYDITDAAIDQLKRRANFLVITDNKSYKAVVSLIAEIRQARRKVENHRKVLKKDALEYGRKVDAVAKSIKERLLAIEASLKAKKQAEDERRAALKAEKERKEKERIKAIKAKIEALPPKNLFEFLASDPSVQELEQIKSKLENVELLEDDYQELLPDAQKAKEQKLAFLNKAIFDARQAEIARKALEEERRKAEEERKAREELEKRLAELEVKKAEPEIEVKKPESKAKNEEPKPSQYINFIKEQETASFFFKHILKVVSDKPQGLPEPLDSIVLHAVSVIQDVVAVAQRELEKLISKQLNQ